MEKPIDRWLGLFAMAVGVVLFLVEKTPTIVVVCLMLIFALLIHPLWNFWWIEECNERRALALVIFIGLLIFLGKMTWPHRTETIAGIKASLVPSPSPLASPQITPAIPSPTPTAQDIAPAGFISFLGPVMNGYAPMMQENQTNAPLDDVDVRMTGSIPDNQSDWSGTGKVIFEQEINIGTVRALLTTGLGDVRFPIDGHERIFVYIFMETRFQTYSERIYITKKSETEYEARQEFGMPTSYKRTTILRVMDSY